MNPETENTVLEKDGAEEQEYTESPARNEKTAETRRVRRRASGKDRRPASWRGRIVRALSFTLAAVIVLLAVLEILLPDRTFSPQENRALEEKPGFSVSAFLHGDYEKNLEKYLSDQFVLRDKWVALKYIEDKMILRKTSHGVYLGKDGYLLAEPERPDPKALTATEEAIKNFAALHPDLPVSLLLVPCASSVYPDKLPGSAPVRDQIADINAVRTALEGSVNAPDLSQSLRTEKNTRMFYRTDHHWTCAGAKRVFEDTAASMNINAASVSYDRYLLSNSFQGTLASRSGSFRIKDKIEIFVPQSDVIYYVNYLDSDTTSSSLYVSDKLEEKDQYTVFLGGNHPLLEIRTTAETGRSLLLFKDSYANSFVQYLIPHFDRIIMVDPRYYYENVSALITAYGVTDVLMLYSANTFLKDTSLADCLNMADSTAAEA